MPLTLIGRYDLAGPAYHPYRPAMGAMDVMFYRRTLTEVRKVIFGVSDTIRATLASGTVGDVIAVGGVSQVINNNFVTGPSIALNGIVRFHAVNADTGVVTVGSLPSQNIDMDKIARSNTRTLGPGTAGGAPDVKLARFDVPITVIASNIGAGVNSEQAKNLGTIESIPFAGNFVNLMLIPTTLTIDPGIIYIDAYRYVESGAGIFSCERLQRAFFRQLNHGNDGANFEITSVSSAKPSILVRDGNGLLHGLSELSTGGIYWHTLQEADLAGTLAANQTDVLIPGSNYTATTTGSHNRACHAGIHINKQFSKAYFAISTDGANVQRLGHQKLPVSADYEFVDVDTGGAGITGIWTFPPFVFVAKTGGATFGPQLIKYSDSDLELVVTTKARRSGDNDPDML